MPEKPEGLSEHARFFDEFSIEWKKNPEFNKVFLIAQEQYANHRFKADGFLFLNDVYVALGLSRTVQGQITGWLRTDDDKYVDFGIFAEHNKDFINGKEPNCWLDFNVDGVMYDKIT